MNERGRATGEKLRTETHHTKAKRPHTTTHLAQLAQFLAPHDKGRLGHRKVDLGGRRPAVQVGHLRRLPLRLLVEGVVFAPYDFKLLEHLLE